MRRLLFALLTMAIATNCSAAEPPVAEHYLHTGKLAQGTRKLKKVLANTPGDDQARFGLAVIQLVSGVQRLGQTLHKYGVKPGNSNQPFVRIPIPENPDPAEIGYQDFRRLIDKFHGDLEQVEATLAKITDDDVKLPLRLAHIQIDLDHDGQATDSFLEIFQAISSQDRPEFLAENPDFLVTLDRGDCAWLRAYCHLLMGTTDVILTVSSEEWFPLWADEVFAKPKNAFTGTQAERREKSRERSRVMEVIEPERLGEARQHFLMIAVMNRETWKHIRAETDNDHEWLPNPQQTGVLGLPAEDHMIDTWLAGIHELELFLKGERVLPIGWFGADRQDTPRLGLNLKLLLDDPPNTLGQEFFEHVPEKYLTEGKFINLYFLMRFLNLYQDSTAVGYADWFN